MYLLPVTTYFDYVRASKNWTILTGGTVLLSILLKSSLVRKDVINQPQGSIQIKLGDLTRVIPSAHEDPYALLEQAGVGIGPSDVLSIDKNQVNVLKTEQIMSVEDSEIPFTTEKRIDSKLPPQTQKVIAGSPGIMRRIFKTIVIGDHPISREIVSEAVIKEPVKKVIITNPAPVPVIEPMVPVARSLPVNSHVQKVLTVESTAYTFTGNNTATGKPPHVGIIAVDPHIIPLGSKLYVEGYGLAVAGDTGGAIKGNKIDVFLNTLKECRIWGRRRVKVYILAS